MRIRILNKVLELKTYLTKCDTQLWLVKNVFLYVFLKITTSVQINSLPNDFRLFDIPEHCSNHLLTLCRLQHHFGHVYITDVILMGVLPFISSTVAETASTSKAAVQLVHC